MTTTKNSRCSVPRFHFRGSLVCPKPLCHQQLGMRWPAEERARGLESSFPGRRSLQRRTSLGDLLQLTSAPRSSLTNLEQQFLVSPETKTSYTLVVTVTLRCLRGIIISRSWRDPWLMLTLIWSWSVRQCQGLLWFIYKCNKKPLPFVRVIEKRA